MTFVVLKTVVLPSGEVIKTRQRTCKSLAGFDVTKLFIGVEGMLGLVTEGLFDHDRDRRFPPMLTANSHEVTVRLAPVIPSQVAIAQFPSVKAATEVVIEILNTGVNIRRFYHLLQTQSSHITLTLIPSSLPSRPGHTGIPEAVITASRILHERDGASVLSKGSIDLATSAFVETNIHHGNMSSLLLRARLNTSSSSANSKSTLKCTYRPSPLACFLPFRFLDPCRHSRQTSLHQPSKSHLRLCDSAHRLHCLPCSHLTHRPRPVPCASSLATRAVSASHLYRPRSLPSS